MGYMREGVGVGNMEKGTMRMGVGEMGIGNMGMRVGEMEWDEEYEPYRDVCGAYEKGEREDRGRADEEGG
jgi:hypothetical protein